MTWIGSAILERLRGGGEFAEPRPKLIVGLGNPGPEYQGTRHNLGFKCVDLLADQHSIDFSDRRSSAVLGLGSISGHRVALAKPRTFVNRSGDAVRYLLARYRASPQDLLIVYDDMDLPLGRVRLRPDGSPGGHNGMRSIVEALGTQVFPRVRLGIGRPPAGVDQVEYVLSTFTRDEETQATEVVELAAKAVTIALAQGMTEAMNRFN